MVFLMVLGSSLIDNHNERLQKAVVSEARLIPEKQFAVEGKIESTMFNDEDIAVITVLPESTPDLKVRRVYIFSHYIVDGRSRWSQKTYCKRTFDLKETVK